jgi:FKBP-type peptidyl-prolyl cis-trans isomerase
VKKFSKYFFAVSFFFLVCANLYALPNSEKKKEESESLIDQIAPSSNIEVVEVDVIKDLPNPISLEDKFSYAYSYLLYLSTLSQNLEINPEYYAKGAIDAAEGKALFSEQEIVEIIQEMQQQMLSRAQEQLELEAKQNLEKAENFLAENIKKSDVIETDSGLQYTIMQEGNGKHPTSNDEVVVNYQIYTQDEQLLVKSDKNIKFELNSLVPGFVEGIELMNVGSKYRFFVHPTLAYGMEGTSEIPPNSLLIFDVELIQIIDDPIS